MVYPAGVQHVASLTGNELVTIDNGGAVFAVCTTGMLGAAPGSTPYINQGTIATTNPSTTREVVGKISLTYAGAVTSGSGSGSIVGARGEVAAGNAATVLGAGYFYGMQGKISAVTGATIGAGAHAFGVVGQFDMSIGHVTGDPQISAVWGDMGATGPSDGWGANSSILSGQNTTLKATNSHTYTYGMANYWTVINSNAGGGSSTIVATATGGFTPSGNGVKLKVSVNGADYYILAAATYS